MLNPVSISCLGSSMSPETANTDLDTATAGAVSFAQSVTGVLLNQIEIVPTGMLYDGTNYVATATVIYGTA